ncbi:MAG: transposase [Acidobacteria bacterium]|nr:transposase [Acidobacteriota bacterium]
MARPTRIEFDGALYHVTSRGVARMPAFVGDSDRIEFLDILSALVGDGHLIVHAFCLMPNHYHMLCETPGGDLGRMMRDLNGQYAQGFNRRHRRVGHLWQARYKAILVQEGEYFLECSRHIHLNPNRSGLTRPAERYRWSSYRNYVGAPVCVEWVTTGRTLTEFGGDRRRYEAWVEAGRGEKPVDPFERAVAGLALGGEEFTRRLVHRMKAAVGREEPSARQLLRLHEKRRSPQQIEQAVEEVFRNEHPRRRARMFLCAQRLYSRMTVREIAERYGKGSSAVSMAVKAISRESEKDPRSAERLRQLGRRLIT